MPYFMASRAVWNYDLSLTVPENTLAALKASLDQSRIDQKALGPMGNSVLTTYFPMTGGRGEIGPLPQWTVMYLLSQDDRAREVMLAVGDSAGSVPIHYRDETSDLPVDLDAYPRIAVRFGTSVPSLPPVSNGTTIWTADTAHQGSFAYVPYLITGDAFYLEEGMFWASWNLTSENPGYRNNGEGLVKNAQIRGQAWMLRSIGEVSRILPDSHSHKSYYTKRMQNNLDWYAASYPNNPDSSALYPLNALPKPDEKHLTGPWQNDFMMLVFSLFTENGEPKAAETLSWLSGFSVERFQQQASGFCMAKAPGYYFNILTTGGTPATTWKELFTLNWPSITSCDGLAIDPTSYPDSASGYAAYGRAMLGAASNAGISKAKSAYNNWKTMTPGVDIASPNNPTWAIVPRL